MEMVGKAFFLILLEVPLNEVVAAGGMFLVVVRLVLVAQVVVVQHQITEQELRELP